MKKIMLIYSVTCLFTIASQAQEKTIWDYPVKPDTKEWEKLKTETERFEAMQIPPELLKSMSTEDLIATCINYPAFGHYTAFNNILYGINHTIKNFNGLQELLRRKDAPSKMLYVYSKLGVSKSDMNNVKADLWWMRLSYFELLLTRKEIIDNLNEKERTILIKEAYKKIIDKTDDKEQNSLFNVQTSLLIIANILDNSNYSDFHKIKKENTEIENFLNTGKLQNASSGDILIKMTNNYIYSK